MDTRPGFETAAAAEVAFYAAFETRDLPAMRAVWSQAEDTVCIHPSGPCLRGWSAIGRSWEQIFSGLGEVRFVLDATVVHEDGAVSVRFAHENIHHGPGFTGQSRVFATNVYRQEAGGWRMVSHHGSPGGVVREPDAGASSSRH